MSTDVTAFIEDLDGGVFKDKLSQILSDVAAAVIAHGKQGKVALELKFDQIGNSSQVQVAHKINYSRPTSRGKLSEENTTITPMHVGKRGVLTFFNVEEQGQLFDRKGDPAAASSVTPLHKPKEA